MKENRNPAPGADITTPCHHCLALPDEGTAQHYPDDFPSLYEADPSYALRKGDLVLIRFPFLEKEGMKLRPSLLLAATQDIVTVCFMTSQRHPQEPLDVLLQPDAGNGLDRETLIKTSRLATLQRSMVVKRIGRLGEAVLQELNRKLMRWLDLP